MKAIWKFELKTTDTQKVSLPLDAEILCVQVQGDKPCLWAMVETANTPEPRLIETFGTGQPIPENMGVSRRYIDTYQIHGGSLVFHVFEYTGV